MARVVEGIESKGPTVNDEAKVQAEHPKLSLQPLRQAWDRWCGSLPCVQTFYAERAAEDKAAEEQRWAGS